MIDVWRFSIRSLWRQLLCNFEMNDLDDAMLILPAIRSHPNFTPAHEAWYQNLISNLLCDSLANANFDWASYLLTLHPQVFPEAAGHAVCRGFSDDEKIDLLDAFLECGWNVNSTDDHDVPIFSLVADCEPLVCWFLSHGANPNTGGGEHALQPIDRAAATGSFSTVKLLLDWGARLQSSAALFHAARRRSHDHVVLPILALLLEQPCPIDINALEDAAQQEGAIPGRSPGTLLTAAVESASVERVRLLLDQGADPRRGDEDGFSPVELARRLGYVDVERVLLEALGRVQLDEDRKEQWVLVDEFEVLELDMLDPAEHLEPTRRDD